ncbi:hypothetical protein [Aestuariivirga sp.]|uniref:hypothetical protein n=1 Tax=Aestuariivirga sp. TaxID=2650926 RepID=UPI0039198824
MTAVIRIVLWAIALGTSSLCVSGAIAREVPIGSITFEARPEREVVNVGGREGEFRGIRFEVRQSDVEVLDLRVVYGNGQTEDIRVRQLFRAGSSSRVIDLGSPRRALRQIVVTYVPKGPARLLFFGVESGGGAGGMVGEWVRLGCKDVRFLIDRDTLRVGRQEGRFSALRLKVRHAPVEMFDLRVTFANGARQDLRVREFIPPGATTRPIDLIGSNRGIDRIEMFYRSIPSNKGTAEVCIDALER